MSSVNHCIFVGNLGAKPEVRHTGTGKAVANFRIAVNDKRGGKETTEWIPVVVWDKLAENCAKFLDKGRQVYVEGRWQSRKWEKDGAERTTVEVVATNVVFLGGGKGSRSTDEDVQDRVKNAFGSDTEFKTVSDDDPIPF